MRGCGLLDVIFLEGKRLSNEHHRNENLKSEQKVELMVAEEMRKRLDSVLAGMMLEYSRFYAPEAVRNVRITVGGDPCSEKSARLPQVISGNNDTQPSV